MNVVLEFGRYRDITAYMLVANMLARRIYKRYQEKTEVAMAGKVTAPTPWLSQLKKLNKFLNL